jgi:hypothetical protein
MNTLQTAGAATDSADALKELIARQAVEIERLNDLLFDHTADKLEKAEREIERLTVQYDLMGEQNAELRARRAELEKQDPAGWITQAGIVTDLFAGNGTKHDGYLYGWKPLFAAAGASPAQPAVENCLWARNGHQSCQHAQPSQAGEPTEAQLIAGVKAMRLFVTKLSLEDFRLGYNAAINAKEQMK